MGGIELERVGKTQSVPYRGAGRAEGRGRAARAPTHSGEQRSGEGSSAHTPSIADGTAEIASWESR